MPETVRYNFTDDRRRRRRESGQGAVMDWARILAYVTGTVDQEIRGRNKYLTAEKPHHEGPDEKAAGVLGLRGANCARAGACSVPRRYAERV